MSSKNSLEEQLHTGFNSLLILRFSSLIFHLFLMLLLWIWHNSIECYSSGRQKEEVVLRWGIVVHEIGVDSG